MKKLFILLITALFISGCKKDDKSQSKTDMLTSVQWKMSAFTISPPMDIDLDGIIDSDLYATYDACNKDDYFVFKKDGTLDINEGPSRCSSYDPQVETVNWAFVNDEKEIIIDGDRGTIKELTASRFVITVPFGNSLGEITFIKK